MKTPLQFYPSQGLRSKFVGFLLLQLSVRFLCQGFLVTAWSNNVRFIGDRGSPLKAASHDDASCSEEISIRDCTFAELNQVADVIMASFYQNATSPWKQMYRLGELNRIQQNFPHNEPHKHRMLVALSEVSGIDFKSRQIVVGFCDIDARRPNQPNFVYNPRPYLSDLCVRPDYRRRGIAQTLVRAAEKFCVADLKGEDLFIHVDRRNVAALEMYRHLGYSQLPAHPQDAEKFKDIVLLQKVFRPDSDDDARHAVADEQTSHAN